MAAGLNFTATGIPYWTTDIGGYAGGNPSDGEYRELFVRWFQYGTFCPIFRSHGRRYPGDTTIPNELWAYGKNAQQICTDFIKLRYSLLPYIYSLSAEVTQHGYTPMRLLAFDFPADSRVLDCKDEFMYGPALLVCPVLHAGATSRSVYLPAGRQWVDFWTGTVHDGGSVVEAAAPLQRIPLFVKAGAIIPRYLSEEKHVNPSAPVEICVYAGADGTFRLYEDDGTTMEYENGGYRSIPLVWDDAACELTIGESAGRLNASRTFSVKMVKDGRSLKAKKVVYNGKALKIRFK